MPLYRINKGDTSPPLQAALVDAKNRAIDLTGATVTFNMEPVAPNQGPGVTAGTVDVYDALNGKVRYFWQTGQTDVTGLYKGTFRVVLANGKIETVPNQEPIMIQIVDL